MPDQPGEHFLTFLRKEQITHDTYSFFFTRPLQSFDFLPGQYIKMFLDLPKDDPRGRNRSFSICSSPEQKDVLMITTKESESKSIFKQTLYQLRSGDNVRFFGPLGRFVLPEQSDKPLVLLAGGIGITPFHSMLLHAASVNYQREIFLFNSYHSVEEIVFYEELKNLSQNHRGINVIFTVSNPDRSWKGETGRISGEMIKKYVSNFMDAEYMLCGPTEMVVSMLAILDEMKILDEHIQEEMFTGY
ncbi:MAG TPA: FAD-dependent oxidoreductase [Patescibacteria group bacterium]|nr:FAD-dependent oxidoreductase [Patescibacteria group bacterium]